MLRVLRAADGLGSHPDDPPVRRAREEGLEREASVPDGDLNAIKGEQAEGN
jgi:hypothetical protein